MECDLCGGEIDVTKGFYLNEENQIECLDCRESRANGGQLRKVFIREIKILLAGCEMGFKDKNITTIGAIEVTVDKLLAEVRKRTKI